MKCQAYDINTISCDLRREDAIKQIADSLEYLEKVSNDIFKRIGNRVAKDRKRLQSINDRVSLAQAKVDKLKNSNKATKVFSSYKYPGSDKVDQYTATFSISDTSGIESDLKGLKRNASKLKTKHTSVLESQLQEKLRFFSVKIAEKNEKIEEEGLGRLPPDIPSISNLLLFNTSENPYKKYVMFDPLGVVTKTRKTLEDEDHEALGAAPITITQREQLEKQNVEGYSYIPGLGDVPEMDVPLALPDLPGIADDLSFGADLGPSIAPSIPGSSAIPDLPLFSPESTEQPTIDATSAAQPPPPPPPQNLAPPPPPPPAADPVKQAPPPPPPPPPPALEEESQPPPVDAPKEVAPSGDARSDLLASIRQAGGSGKARLKNVQDLKIEAKKKKQEEKTVGSGGGDLMSDLFNKLSMRRKGISGTGKPNTNEADNPNSESKNSSVGQSDSLMGKISSMIPPPPRSNSVHEASNEEDEWSD